MNHEPTNTMDKTVEETLTGAALIADHVTRLPGKPGVYRMIGDDGDVLYVGKARNLKNELRKIRRS